MKEGKYAVIGLGHFGRAIATSLAKSDSEVVVIDKDEEKIYQISDDVSYAVTSDATDKRALLAQDIRSFDVVIITIGDFEQRLLCAATLIDLNIKRIVCRAMGSNERLILEKMGITDILSPEDEVGKAVARRLLNPSMVSYLDLPDDHCVMEIEAPKHIIGKELGLVNLRDNYRLSLITIKRRYEGKNNELHIVGVPGTKTLILKGDTMILFGKTKDIEKFVEINN